MLQKTPRNAGLVNFESKFLTILYPSSDRAFQARNFDLLVSSSDIDKKLDNKFEIDKKNLENRDEIFKVFANFEFYFEFFCQW